MNGKSDDVATTAAPSEVPSDHSPDPPSYINPTVTHGATNSPPSFSPLITTQHAPYIIAPAPQQQLFTTRNGGLRRPNPPTPPDEGQALPRCSRTPRSFQPVPMHTGIPAKYHSEGIVPDLETSPRSVEVGNHGRESIPHSPIDLVEEGVHAVQIDQSGHQHPVVPPRGDATGKKSRTSEPQVDREMVTLVHVKNHKSLRSPITETPSVEARPDEPVQEIFYTATHDRRTPSIHDFFCKPNKKVATRRVHGTTHSGVTGAEEDAQSEVSTRQSSNLEKKELIAAKREESESPSPPDNVVTPLIHASTGPRRESSVTAAPPLDLDVAPKQSAPSSPAPDNPDHASPHAAQSHSPDLALPTASRSPPVVDEVAERASNITITIPDDNPDRLSPEVSMQVSCITSPAPAPAPAPAAEPPVQSPLSYGKDTAPSLESFEEDIEYEVLKFHSEVEAVWLPFTTAAFSSLAFIHLPLIIASLGVARTLACLAAALVVMLLSWVSVSALLTNHPLPQGGAFYIFSRQLGSEWGGGVGSLYCISFVLLIPLHARVAGEAMYYFMLDSGIDLHVLSDWGGAVMAFAVLVVLGVVVYHGVKYVSLIEALSVFAALLALASGVVGLITCSPSSGTLRGNMTNRSGDLSLFEGFARILPALLGLPAAISRPADLRSPMTVLPAACLRVILVNWLVLVGLVIGMGAAMGDAPVDHQRAVLFLARTAWPVPHFFKAVAVVAICGQCMQALLIAPRALFAIAQDNLFPCLSQLKDISHGEPVNALLACSTASVLLIPTREYLHHIAAVVTLGFFFLLNFAASQKFITSSNWNPTSPYYSWRVSAFATAVTLAALFTLQWYPALSAVVGAFVLAKAAEYFSDLLAWGDGPRGVMLQQALDRLLMLEGSRPCTINWRPQLLVLGKLVPGEKHTHTLKHPRILVVAEQLQIGKGLNVIAGVADVTSCQIGSQLEFARKRLQDKAKSVGLKGFCTAVVAPSFVDGCSYFLQTCGVGLLEPNSVLMAWPEGWKDTQGTADEIVEVLQVAYRTHKAVLMVKGVDYFPSASDELEEMGTLNGPMVGQSIHLWWILKDAGIELLLAFLLRRHVMWQKCTLKIFSLIPRDADSDDVARQIAKELCHLKIAALLTVIPVDNKWLKEFYDEQASKARGEACRANTIEHDFDHVMAKANILSCDLDGKAANGPCNGLTRMSPEEEEQYNATANGAATLSVVLEDHFPMVDLPQEPRAPKSHFQHINSYIRIHSETDDLVIIGMPDPTLAASPVAFMAGIDALLHGIRKAILVRGTGHELITRFR